MTAREWKPGDVVRVRQSGENRVALRGPEFWQDQWGTEWDDSEIARYGSSPLVVIDPEDREQVKRLADAYERIVSLDADVADYMQSALREFANPTPPKPDEPQGLGAVVEAIYGNRFVRVERDKARPWERRGGGGSCAWGEIAVVRVLSEGVTND